MDSDLHCLCCNFKRPRHVKSSRDYSLLHVTKNSLHRSYFRPTPSARLLSLGTIPLLRPLYCFISYLWYFFFNSQQSGSFFVVSRGFLSFFFSRFVTHGQFISSVVPRFDKWLIMRVSTLLTLIS